MSFLSLECLCSHLDPFSSWTIWQELQVQRDQEFLVDLEVQVLLGDHLSQMGFMDLVGPLIHLNHPGQGDLYRVDLLLLLLQEGFHHLQKEHFLPWLGGLGALALLVIIIGIISTNTSITQDLISQSVMATCIIQICIPIPRFTSTSSIIPKWIISIPIGGTSLSSMIRRICLPPTSRKEVHTFIFIINTVKRAHMVWWLKTDLGLQGMVYQLL